jgi:hypothetical protein
MPGAQPGCPGPAREAAVRAVAARAVIRARVHRAGPGRAGATRYASGSARCARRAQPFAFVLRQPAPDPEPLVVGQGVLQARRTFLAGPADPLGLMRGTARLREEELRPGLRAQGFRPPAGVGLLRGVVRPGDEVDQHGPTVARPDQRTLNIWSTPPRWEPGAASVRVARRTLADVAPDPGGLPDAHGRRGGSRDRGHAATTAVRPPGGMLRPFPGRQTQCAIALS